MIKYTKYTVLLFLVLAIFFVAKDRQADILLYSHTPSDFESIVRQKPYWKKILKKTDSAKFYEVLKKAYQDNYYKHVVGHIFGEILYEKEGIGGIEICDSSLFWGCYHALSIKAISESGLSVTRELASVCDRRFDFKDSACHHGIGHGLFEFFGTSKVNEALTLCDDISVSGESCHTGVLMEYHFPTESGGDAFTQGVRPLVPGGEYSICPELTDSNKEPCYFELPRWWERVFESDFEKMGRLCANVTQEELRHKCFWGIGDSASLITDHNPNETVGLCEKMPTDPDVDTCLVSASWGYLGAGKADGASQICKKLSIEDQIKCPKI
jgi:hypothetical protein